MTDEQRLLWFRRLARLAAVFAAGVVVLGAWVRLTNAGLGCPDWPGCYGHLYPQTSHHFAEAVHEMVHRYFAGTLVTLIVALFVWAWVNRRVRGQPLLPVAVLFLLVCVQAVLGMKTVTLLLQPLIVTSHLLGGLSTLAVLWWLSLEPKRRPLTHPETSLRKFVLVGVCAARTADRAWRLDQQQLCRDRLSRPAHLPGIVVACHGLPRRVRSVARSRGRLRGRRAR